MLFIVIFGCVVGKFLVITALVNSLQLESVVVEVNGKDLLEQLRPTEIPSDNNNEVPAEWMAFIWPYISILGERIRVNFLISFRFLILSCAFKNLICS